MFTFINIRPRRVICWQKLCIYRNIKVEFCHEKYLNDFSNVYLLTTLRSGTLKLNIELGRYNNKNQKTPENINQIL
jgi:hypothetical protein